MSQILITKKSGDQVLFDENKLRLSLEKSGADKETIERVLDELLLYINNGMSTHKVYKKAYSILSKISHRTAGRYRLKSAIMELGPTGFPFEKFIGAIIENQGFDTSTGMIIQGKCVTHEVDVVAENEDKIIVVECKFHREGNRKSDVKVPLYIRSRFNDIYDQWVKEDKIKGRKFEGWVVTNTRFTGDAEKFGKCSGLKLVAWDYPNDDSLKNMIDKSGLHPLTSLKTLTKKEKENILEQGVVLCKELSEEVLLKSGIAINKTKKVLFEASNLTESF
jgi:Holliday junction resolvase-like predicted endonuclease